MRKRIKQRLTAVPLHALGTASEMPAWDTITPELLENILANLDSGRVNTYEQITETIGGSVERRITKRRIGG